MVGSRSPLQIGRWLWPAACLVTLLGYFGSWVAHSVAGLAVLGLDLGEYVKFLPAVASGETHIWREGFYLPLFVVSFACGLLTYRPTYRYAFWLRLTLILIGIVAALNMLPPAWSPAVLRSAEFRLQTAGIALSLVLLAASPVLALMPPLPVYGLLAGLSAAAISLPAWGFLRVLPSIAELYGHALRPALAFYVTILGLVLLTVACGMGYRRETTST